MKKLISIIGKIIPLIPFSIINKIRKGEKFSWKELVVDMTSIFGLIWTLIKKEL